MEPHTILFFNPDLSLQEEWDINKFYELKKAIIERDKERSAREKAEAALKEEEIRLSERKDMLFKITHDIKNLVRSVIDPLEELKKHMDFPEKSTIINALAGINLIGKIAKDIHYSFRGTPEDFLKDFNCADGEKSTFTEIFFAALRYSVDCMFDGRNYPNEQKLYFPTGDSLRQAAKAKTSVNDLTSMSNFINKFMCHFDFSISQNIENIVLSDNHDSATKFLLMLQELLLNAIKYARFSSFTNRYIKIKLGILNDNIVLNIENSTDKSKNPKSENSGLGHINIQDYVKMFSGKIQIDSKELSYSVSISIPTTGTNKEEQQ